MTIEEYLTNPLGRSDASMMLGTVRKKLDQEFSILQNAIRVQWYFIDKKSYVAHIKIPSSTQSHLFYDVLVDFDVSSIQNGVDFRKKTIRVFSNCPSFVYTYARIFYQQKMLIPWATVKYESKVLGLDPEKRNPGKIVNYEKSLYFAFKYLNKHASYYRRIIPSEAREVKDYSNILRGISSTKQIRDKVEKKKKRSINPKKEKRSTAKKKPEVSQKRSSSLSRTKKTKKSASTKKTKSTKKI